MVEPRRFTLSKSFACIALGIAAFLSAPVSGDSREARQLKELRQRIEQLQRTLNETTGKRDAAREELHAEERRIDQLARSLREIDARLVKTTRTLNTLDDRTQHERRARREHLAMFAAQTRTAFALGRQPQLKVLLNQEHPAATARVLAYYRYFNEARASRIEEAQSRLGRLEELSREIHRHTDELTTLREANKRERQMLDASRRRRAELLAHLERRVSDQSEHIDRLRADERRLERLVRELKQALPEADIPFPDSHRRFASLKGRLPLPLVGRVVARYGEPKGVGDLTWRGIFLSGNEGQEVRAVAHGRVAFADWLRGFGLLLILDHGDGYMTLYGHNETLHRRTGDWVEAGQPVATVGRTGDAPGIGVYFEVRHKSVPHDPLQWCALGTTGSARTRR